MTAILNALRWDVLVQARNGFYWASARANSTVWVPAILVISLLQITTFFFVAGLMLLERDERCSMPSPFRRFPRPVTW